MTRFVDRALPWTDRTRWAWPEGDEKLIGVFDQVADVDVIMRHVPADRRTACVQAGGACGVWPRRFALEFGRVFTFEPLAENWACLRENVRDAEGGIILAQNVALSDHRHRVGIRNDVSEANNAGAGYIVPDDAGVWAITIDSLALAACDLIQLDIEGAELEALRGADETIRAYRPVICLEIKDLPHMTRPPRLAVEHLEKRGYRVAEKVHRDVILVPA